MKDADDGGQKGGIQEVVDMDGRYDGSVDS